jgi:hypothetical protein
MDIFERLSPGHTALYPGHTALYGLMTAKARQNVISREADKIKQIKQKYM